ncbi:MAG: hypothetical protein NZ903_02895, partial [Candidatus Micrarchaeota archaeon]|nr:hypothetical protein [Candidatus Micrarchaeota archaeon]
FKIINKQPVPSELYEVASVILSGNSTSLTQLIRNETDTLILQSPINTYTKVMLYVENRDTINHTIRVEATGDEVSVPASSTYIFELSRNTILTDKTILNNLTRSGVTNEKIKNALSQIPISIVGPSEIKLNKSGSNGDILNLAAPKDAMTAILYENNTGKTLVITFTDTKERILENPLNNLTLDLPVQVVHGDLSSQTLYSMRKYADEGAMSMLIPSFRNATVKIHSSVFSPEEAFIPAGSTITFTNKDVVDHDIELTRNESGSVSRRSFILMPLQSNSTSDTPKNTTFIFVDRLSNMKGNITTVAYDANIGVISTPIYPESGMVAVGGPVKFNNYDSDSSYVIEISLRDESNVVHDYRLNLPKYSNGIPGMATWIPDRVGNATYVVKNATLTIGSGEIVVKNSIINVSIKDGYFEKKSIAVDHNSKVCFVPNSPRNITITNLDTGEKIAERTIYPVGGQYTDTSGLCKKIYNCTAKQPGSYACSGIVNESDLSTYCSYTILNSSSACKVSSNISCMVKNEYSSDLECTTDYSKDVQPNIPGIQPQCLFQAKIDGDACKGGSVVRNNSLDSIINCSISSDGKLQFNYFSGKEKTNVSNVLCTVSKSGSSTVCSPTGIYPDIGCVNGSAGDPNCYYTPSPLSISELGNPFTVVENRFCNIGRSTRQEIYYIPYLCNISWDFSKDSSCVCPATRYCGDLPCNGKTAFGAIYVYRTLPSSCGVGSDKNTYTCVNNVLSRTCYTSRSQYSVNTPLGSFSTKLTYGLSFKLCECYSKKIVNSEYVSSCQIKTGGSALLPFPSSCILTAERC